MAVDTRDKRMSIMSVSLPWRGAFPLADGAITAPDRLIFPYYYSGIPADNPAPSGAAVPANNNPLLASAGKMMMRG